MFRAVFLSALFLHTLACAETSSEALQIPVRFRDPVFDEVTVTSNVIYGRNKTQAGYEQKLTLDIYEPKGDTLSKRPVIILAHGGFFLFGNKLNFEMECAELAKAGFVAVSINYRLIDVAESVVSYKRAVVDAVFDMKAAVRFFRKDASTANKYSVDAQQIFIGGYSAGAITSLHYGYVNAHTDVFQLGGNLMLNYVRIHGGAEGDSGNSGYPSAVQGIINIAGSLHHAGLVDANEPPLFSVHGTADDIVPYETGVSGESAVTTEGSGLIHKRANEIGLINKLITVEGANHFAFFECTTCPAELRNFLFENLHR